jgi:5-methylthioribose kinase
MENLWSLPITSSVSEMIVRSEDIQSLIAKEIPDFVQTEEPKELEGGNLNYVWRLQGEQQNLVIKIAPPYIAANPDVPLSPDRINFEAKALQLFRKENPLHSIQSNRIRPPEIVLFDPGRHLLIMEDIGTQPHLGEIDINALNISNFGSMLGRFIGNIHRETYQNEVIKQGFNNADIQQTRKKVQYNPTADYLQETGASDGDSNLISRKTKALGQALLEPGKCLVVGDLWPPSLVIDQDKIRIIDWEFVHFGRPLQDVAHFAAHCWMQTHISSSQMKSDAFKKIWDNFWNGYQQAVGDFFPDLFDDPEFHDAATHIGAEILVRAAGPFKAGYVYQKFGNKHPLIKEAGQKARELIMSDDWSPLWE